MLLDEGGSGSPGRWRFVTSPNIASGIEAGVTASGNIAQNAWTHLVATWSLSGSTYTINLYVNGVFQGSNTWTGTPGAGGMGNFHFGNSGDYPDNYFKGRVDDVRVYNRMLPQAEVTALYNRSAGTRFNSSTGVLGNSSGLASGLAGWWSFDAPTIGTTVQDLSGQGNNGSVGGGVSTTSMKTAGKLGQALQFNGTGFVTVPYSASLAPTGAISFGGWFRTTDKTAVQHILSKTQSGGYSLTFNTDGITGYLLGYVRVGGAYLNPKYATTNLSNNTWYHAFVTYDGTTARLYVNGTLADSAVSSGAIQYGSTNNFCIGYEPGTTTCNAGEGFLGTLDDIRVYNRGLTSAEVAQLYQQGGVKVANAATLQSGTTLANGLTGYWSFNGADVTDKVYDRAGTNNGYFYNAATSSAKVQGKLGQGLRFNGSNAYVRVPDAAAIDNNAFTISAWVKYTSSQLGGIMSKASGGTEMLLLVGGGTCGSASASGKIRFDVSISSSISCADSAASYNDGKWHLVTATRDGSGTGNMVLYVDGVSVATATRAGDMTTSQPLAIGQHIPASTWYFNGSMDEVRMYNRALSAAEVSQLYNLGK
jgi:hypothetical protein